MKTVTITAVAAAALALAPSASADGYEDMHAAVEWLANKYGISAYTNTAPLPYKVYAIARDNLITFNSLYDDNPALLREHLVLDIATGYHNGGACTPEQWVAAHEYGHIIDNTTGMTAQQELATALANGFGGTVSTYATTSIDEALAEAFVSVECGNPTPAESAIYEMLVS